MSEETAYNRSNVNGKTGSENSTEVGRRKITKDRWAFYYRNEK